MTLIAKIKESLPTVTGKVFVITGTTSGTGFAAAQTVAEKGGEVVLLNRKSSRSEAALEKLKAAVPEGKFVQITCDLQDFASVRTAADEVVAKYDKIYCLANNAGIMAMPDEATKDGYDTQMQTNHLSHFLLTAKLFPLLVAGAKEYNDARIVNQSSSARAGTPNGLDEKYFGKNGGNLGGDEVPAMMKGGPWERYSQSKLANSVFAQALHSKLQAKEGCKNIRAIASHPGGSKTSIGTHLKDGVGQKIMWSVMGLFFLQSAEDGAAGLLKGMMDPEAKSGELYGPKKIKGAPIPHELQPYETDEKAKEMLWRTSEEATGEKFDI